MGVFVGLGVLAVAAIGGRCSSSAREAARPRPPPPPQPSSRPPVSATPSASAATPVAAACPEGTVAIPGGSFYMGSDDDLAVEKPAHQVTLDAVLHRRVRGHASPTYKACSDAGRCKRAGTTNDWDNITDKESKAFDPLCNIRDPGAKAKHPINCVDWDMADKFCQEQGKRLPTEAEWEFAARGPDGRKYPWGDEDPGAGRMNACGKECMAWGAKNGIEEKAMYDVDDGFPNTAPVGSFPKGGRATA